VSKWCTVTVTEPDGRRHSLDVLAESTYDAAHLFVVEAKKERAVGLPKPTLATVFEVVASGRVYRVAGMASSAGLWSDGRNGTGRKAICSASVQDWNDGHLTNSAPGSPCCRSRLQPRSTISPRPPLNFWLA